MNRAECLDTANTIVHKDRQTSYGTPENNFGVIADMWTAYAGYDFKPHDVAVMMSLLKIARLKTSPDKPDNWVDLAGYASCGCELATKNDFKAGWDKVERTC